MKIAIIAVFIMNFSLATTTRVQSNIENALNQLSRSEDDNQVSEVQPDEVVTDVLCGENTSMPFSLFRSLLLDREKTFQPEVNPNTGQLIMDFGPMIANCNDMLNFSFARPEGQLPYVFEVGFKNCGNETCSYDVYIIREDDTTGGFQTKSYSPNLEGFYQCLQDSGVLSIDDNQNVSTNDNKVYEREMVRRFANIQASDEIWFASYGNIAGTSINPVVNDTTESHQCYHFSHFNSSGHSVVYSPEDLSRRELRERAERVCNYDSYRSIENALVDFLPDPELYNMLEAIRDELLLEEYRNFRRLLNTESDYGSIGDLSGKEELINDFYDIIITPLIDEIRDVHRDYVFAEGARRRELREELEALVDELAVYAVDPYLNTNDIDRMMSFERNAPLENESWLQAIAGLNLIQTTIGLYAEYENGVRTPTNDKDDEIGEYQEEFEERLGILSHLSNDDDYSHVQELQRRESILDYNDQVSRQNFEQDVYYEQMNAMQRCSEYYIASNPVLHNHCISSAEREIAYMYEDFSRYQSRSGQMRADIQGSYNYWGGVEAQRAQARGYSVPNYSRGPAGIFPMLQGLQGYGQQSGWMMPYQGQQSFMGQLPNNGWFGQQSSGWQQFSGQPQMWQRPPMSPGFTGQQPGLMSPTQGMPQFTF